MGARRDEHAEPEARLLPRKAPHPLRLSSFAGTRNSFDLYTKLPATVESSSRIARIGSLLDRFGANPYDYGYAMVVSPCCPRLISYGHPSSARRSCAR